MAEEIRLTRAGHAPLVFAGELVAEKAAKPEAGRSDHLRWHDLRVYRTAGGKLVAEIVFRTEWKRETDEHAAIACDDEGALIDALRSYDPVRPGIGFPPGAQFREKQARLEAGLPRDYEARVTAVLEQLGAEERIE